MIMDALPENIATMKVADLKKELKSRGLAVTGNKTELVERLQLAVMPSEGTEDDDSALLEEADNILGEEDEGATPKADAVPAAAAPEKKKVAIKRDSALPAMTTTEAAPAVGDTPDKPEEKKAEEEPKKTEEPLPTHTPTGKKRITGPGEGDSSAKKQITVIGGPPKEVAPAASPEKTTEAEEKTDEAGETAKPATASGPMTDAERAAKRAARFGVTPSATSDDKKADRAARFGLKNGSGSIGGSPSADLETLKKRAERFGQSSSTTMKKLEMSEQQKKRQERFGTPTAGGGPSEEKKAKVATPNENLMVDEKIKKRAERFGTEIKAT